MTLIDRYGFRIVRGVVSTSDCKTLSDDIKTILQADQDGRIEGPRGGIVGGRNLIEHPGLWSQWIADPRISKLIQEHVGSAASVVRVLFFDKPPGQGWALPLHRDRTIAVAEHQHPPHPFSRPTRKAGVPHVQANDELLAQMLTLRLHLDPVRADNGALYVVPRSHLNEIGEIPEAELPPLEETPQTIFCRAGDVFAMRPLLSHGSHAADPATKLRRRVLHVEVAPQDALPAPYRWHAAQPIFERE